MTFDFSSPSSLDLATNASIQGMRDSLERYSDRFGTMLTTADSIGEAVSWAAVGETITLFPGRYKFAGSFDLDKKVRLQAFGRVVFEGSGTYFTLSADEAEVVGVCFEHRNGTTGTDSPIDVTGDRCRLVDLKVNVDLDYGIYVTGSGVVVQGCRFEDSTAHSGSTDSDIYWADGATNGQAVMNVHSTTRAYVLDYRSVDNMSEAGNGRSAIINAR